ncbi:hypothetical protein EJ02DRAFT_348489, partial [Clathrospora elynae]
GKGTLIKEHVNWMVGVESESRYLHGYREWVTQIPSNPTCIPDSFFENICPTFLIRHPALTVPSLFRTALDNEGLDEVLKASTEKTMRWECTYHWHMTLYKYLITSGSYPRPSHAALPTVSRLLLVARLAYATAHNGESYLRW